MNLIKHSTSVHKEQDIVQIDPLESHMLGIYNYIPIIITQLKSYLYVTAILEFYSQSGCYIRVF